MAAPGESPRRSFRAPRRGGPLGPMVGVCVGVVVLTAAVTLGGEDTPTSTVGGTGVVTAAAAADPTKLPLNACVLKKIDGTSLGMSVTEARTLTQIAAVGWQVKAPEEMVARVLDLARAKPNQALSVTDALDLFTREDSAAPSAGALAALRALTEPEGLTCVFEVPPVAAETKNSSGLTPRAEAMRQGVIDAFGKLTMSGYGSKAPRNSPEAAGRALNVAVPEAPLPGAGAGWVLAHWLMARGAEYKLAAVAYVDRLWVPGSGWQATAPGQPGAVHVRPGRVHVAVAAGASASKDTQDGKKSRSGKRRS